MTTDPGPVVLPVWDALVAELGDPLPAPVPVEARPPVPATTPATEPTTVPLRLRATGATATGATAAGAGRP